MKEIYGIQGSCLFYQVYYLTHALYYPYETLVDIKFLLDVRFEKSRKSACPAVWLPGLHRAQLYTISNPSPPGVGYPLSSRVQ